jgi:hypothetical protein
MTGQRSREAIAKFSQDHKRYAAEFIHTERLGTDKRALIHSTSFRNLGLNALTLRVLLISYSSRTHIPGNSGYLFFTDANFA